MANSFGYDHPHYVVRRFYDGLAGTGSAAGAHHVSAFAENLWNAHYRVDVAGTLTSNAVQVINVSATTTSTIATTTIGTAVAGSTAALNSVTATTNTSVSLAAGSVTFARMMNDLTGQVRVVWEVQVPPNTAVTAFPG